MRRFEIIHHGFNLFMFEVAALFGKYRKSKITELTRKEEIVMNFTKLVSTRFREERKVQFYAGLLFVTPEHLSKTVKEVTARTYGELIDEMVVNEAKIYWMIYLCPLVSKQMPCILATSSISVNFSKPKPE